MNTFQYQSRNYTPRVDLTTLGKSIDTLEQGHKEAIKTASALETAIAKMTYNLAQTKSLLYPSLFQHFCTKD